MEHLEETRVNVVEAHQMIENRLPAPVVERLSRVRAREDQLLRRLDALGDGSPSSLPAVDPLAVTRALAARHLRAIDEFAAGRGADLARPLAVGDGDGRRSLSSELEAVAGAGASIVTAYGALYAAARLLYEADVCDLAAAHAAAWREALQAIQDRLVEEVHGELLADGLTCRCVCPACGIGACGCTRNSIDTVRRHWGQPVLEPTDGLLLRIPPRPGSQLAEAGLGRGDRIVAVEGEVVHDNAELQRALRRHPLGEAMPIQVQRDGRADELRVARVSDLPS